MVNERTGPAIKLTDNSSEGDGGSQNSRRQKSAGKKSLGRIVMEIYESSEWKKHELKYRDSDA